MLLTYRAVNDHILEKVRREGYEIRFKTSKEINHDLEEMEKSTPHLIIA